MTRKRQFFLSVVAGMFIGSSYLLGQQISTIRGATAPSGYSGGQTRFYSGPGSPGFTEYPNAFPGFGGYSSFFSPFYASFALGPNNPYLPNYWWVSIYPIGDPRQDGYNPSSGYPWESVTALLIETYPAKARIILDGIFVGTTNNLGPVQLPVGEHSLRVEASGYEPSETVLKIERPTIQQLEIRLNPAPTSPKPAPRS